MVFRESGTAERVLYRGEPRVQRDPYFELNLCGARDMLQVGAGCSAVRAQKRIMGQMRKSGGQCRGAERRGEESDCRREI